MTRSSRYRLSSAMLAILLLAGTAGPAAAAPFGHMQDVARDSAGGAGAAAMSLGQAVAAAQQRTGGRVLAASAAREGGTLVYRIKVLTRDGRVQVLVMDARSGRWLR